jgi:hypothetical protein
MIRLLSVLGITLIVTSAGAKKPETPLPVQFEVGRHTFFDFGPPNDYYEIFIVTPASNGTSVERITLTPAADKCFRGAQVETASAVIPDSISELFGSSNPCAIPEKELRREIKRCKKCLVFSGANVALRTRCGGEERTIRADILDRDMFDANPRTPEHTSWTMQLLGKLDRNLAPGVMQKPMIPGLGTIDPPTPGGSSPELERVKVGDFDSLFPGAPHKASQIYMASQNALPQPSVNLVSSMPFAPENVLLPKYPRIAQLANASGQVIVEAKANEEGDISELNYKSGFPMFKATTEEALRRWKFPKTAVGQQIKIILDYTTNCHRD